MSLPANIAVLLVVAVLSAGGIGGLLWWVLGRPSVHAGDRWTVSNSFDLTKTVLAVVGGIGAVVALVIAYRKQQLGEAAEHREHAKEQREDIKLFAERFTKATDQLGSEKAPVRLAGMYALEGLAKGSPPERQTIVNVLCAYLRMPYLPPSPAPTNAIDPDDPKAPSNADDGLRPSRRRKISAVSRNVRSG